MAGSPLQSATVPRIPRWIGGRRPKCVSAISSARSERSRAVSSRPWCSAISAIGSRSGGCSSPYCALSSWARAATSAPRSQRPPHSSTHASCQRAHAATSSSRSRHSSYVRSQMARASSTRRSKHRLPTIANRAVPDERRIAVCRGDLERPRRESVRVRVARDRRQDGTGRRARRRSGGHRRGPRRARVRLARSASASMKPVRKRIARASRVRMAARSAGVDVASSAVSSRSAARSRLSRSASTTRASARSVPALGSARTSATIARARLDSPAARCARAAASARRWRAGVAGVAGARARPARRRRLPLRDRRRP